MTRRSLCKIALLVCVTISISACHDPHALQIQEKLTDNFISMFSASHVSSDLIAIEITVGAKTMRFAAGDELDGLHKAFVEWKVESYNSEIVRNFAWKRHEVGSLRPISKDGSVSFPLYRANERGDLMIIRTYAPGSRGGALFYLLIPPAAQERFRGLFKAGN